MLHVLTHYIYNPVGGYNLEMAMGSLSSVPWKIE